MPSYGQALTIQFVAWDTGANKGKTGDGANFTMRWVKDGVSSALNTATVTEIDATNTPGLYKCSINGTEASCYLGTLCGVSSTANVSIIPQSVTFERNVTLDTTEPLGTPRNVTGVASASITLNDALWGAVAQGFGKWIIAGTSLTLYTPDGATIVRAFTLDSASSPTQRV